MNNEGDIHSLEVYLWSIHVVDCINCDWDAWLKESRLIHVNSWKLIVCDLSSIQNLLRNKVKAQNQRRRGRRRWNHFVLFSSQVYLYNTIWSLFIVHKMSKWVIKAIKFH